MSITPVPFDLVETKLAAPLTRPGTVAKADVIAWLCAASAPLATVVAPAGYGKTTMLARWAEADPRPFAWVALDGQDDDAVVFLRYIAAAIHRVEPLPSEVFHALSGPGGTNQVMRVSRVGAALADVDKPLVLVLDDLHAVGNPTCLEVLAELLPYVPAGSLIAVTSREEPALPLARWRTQGWVHEIDAADLRLNEQEAGLLLGAAGVELEADEVSELTQRTEGWPAGLYLAALSIQAGATGEASVGTFSGNDRFVSDYFRLELLSRLPAAEAQFLTHTSILERMCGGLCDVVLETTGSAQTLETVGRANGFVVRLDRRGEWYRYHHLFAELLRNELERREPEVVPALNARAMAWCIANGLPEEAIKYGHAAGETSTVAGLIDALLLAAYYDGRMETAERWLSWFGDDELAEYPALAVYGAWFRALTGRPEEAERWLALADGATSTIPLSDGSKTVAPWVATLRAHMMAAGVDQALADANRALDQLSTESVWIPVALGARGVAHALLGDTEHAAEDFAATIEIGLAGGAFEDVFVAHSHLARLAADRGAWGEAGQHALMAQALIEEHHLGDYSTCALAHVVSARIALQEGRREDSRAALARAHRLRPLLDHGLPWLTVEVGLELVRAHLALGEAAAARTILTETQRVLALRPDLGSLVAEARELGDRVEASSEPAGAWAMSLTGAELRLLPYLATHLTFPEIASRLFISRNTVKTEAVSIYRKLTASSRSEAIERAIEVGLLESSILPRANLTQKG
jgi:LuxR family transcriptional regulator, maltose regulon positive regulatory protein